MYKGTGASAGIGIGTAVVVEESELVIERREISDTEAEIQRFRSAVDRTIADTERMAQDLASRAGEKEAEIMQGHMLLLADPMLTGEIENAVRNEMVNSETAIENVCNMYAEMFASMGDELMQQRAADMRDIKTRMQRSLMGIQSADIASLPAGSILVARDLTPSMTAGINPAKVAGIEKQLAIMGGQRWLHHRKRHKSALSHLQVCDEKARALVTELEALAMMERVGHLTPLNRERLEVCGVVVGDGETAEKGRIEDIVTNYHVTQVLALRRELREELSKL